MSIGRFELNTCYHEDCIQAMKEIPDKSFDLCMTDPPYNVTIGSSGFRKQTAARGRSQEVFYDDSMTEDEYIEFTKQWFSEASRVCKRLIITPGENNLIMWITEIKKPEFILYHYKVNSNATASYAYLMVLESILVYGDWYKKQSFKRNCFEIQLKSRNTDEFLSGLIHPCLKCFELWEALLNEYMTGKNCYPRPNAILEPFLGSGTTAELAEENGIHWLGFEKNPIYKHDIDLRIARGKRTFSRRTMQGKVI
jgi:site-specific DNA-methyltransferase (adenine-specific)